MSEKPEMRIDVEEVNVEKIPLIKPFTTREKVILVGAAAATVVICHKLFVKNQALHASLLKATERGDFWAGAYDAITKKLLSKPLTPWVVDKIYPNGGFDLSRYVGEAVVK